MLQTMNPGVQVFEPKVRDRVWTVEVIDRLTGYETIIRGTIEEVISGGCLIKLDNGYYRRYPIQLALF